MPRYLLLAALFAAGAAHAAPADDLLVVDAAADYAAARDAVALSPSALRALLDDDRPAVRRTARALLARQANPELAELIATASPRLTTRDGRPRFALDALAEPGAGPLVLERVLHGGDALDVRLALLGTLPGERPWVTLLGEGFDALDAPELRAMSVSLVARARTGTELLERGLVDPDPLVRAAAARGVVSVPGDWSAPLLRALSDDSASVRAAGVRSLGIVGHPAHADQIRPLLADGSPEVRMEALSAARRLAPAAESWPEALRLLDDTDPTVRARAEALLPPR